MGDPKFTPREQRTIDRLTGAISLLDHGALNIPLGKRGNIDSQIDQYKRIMGKAERREAASASAKRRTTQEEARRLFAMIPRQHLVNVASRQGVGFSTIRDAIKDLIWSRPDAAIRMLTKMLAGAGHGE